MELSIHLTLFWCELLSFVFVCFRWRSNVWRSTCLNEPSRAMHHLKSWFDMLWRSRRTHCCTHSLHSDTSLLLKDLIRASFWGKVFGFFCQKRLAKKRFYWLVESVIVKDDGSKETVPAWCHSERSVCWPLHGHFSFISLTDSGIFSLLWWETCFLKCLWV